MNIANNIVRGARLFPNKTAIIFEQREYSYEEMDLWSNKVAAGLSSLGICRGDRVGLFMPNIPEFAAIYLGCQKFGAIAVSLNASLGVDEVEHIIRDCGVVVMFVDDKLRNILSSSSLNDNLVVININGNPTGHDISFDSWFHGEPSDFLIAEMEKNDPAAILYTSGTTGLPKGACLSHGNIISNMYSFNHNCGMRSSDRLMLFLPLSHCFGQNAILNSAFNACATIVLHRSFDPLKVVASLLNDKVTMLFAVPTAFIPIYNLVSPSEMDMVRYFFSAAATLPHELARRWYEKYERQINQGYGLTETSPFACYNHSLLFRPNSIGSPIENVEMRVVNPETGKAVPIGESGELLIRGPNVMLGYWNRPNETAEAIVDGWFRTGDVGRMDEDGYFYIVDRIKDMINVGGLKVYPAEVENVIYQHPAVEEVGVFGVHDSLTGERLCAHVVLRRAAHFDLLEINKLCREHLADYKVPDSIRIVDSLPKSPTGKILKRVLRSQEKLLIALEDDVPGQTKTLLLNAPQEQRKSLLEAFLRDTLVSVLGLECVPSSIQSLSFIELGLDSQKAIRFYNRLKTDLVVDIPITVAFEYPSLSELVEYLVAEVMDEDVFRTDR